MSLSIGNRDVGKSLTTLSTQVAALQGEIGQLKKDMATLQLNLRNEINRAKNELKQHVDTIDNGLVARIERDDGALRQYVVDIDDGRVAKIERDDATLRQHIDMMTTGLWQRLSERRKAGTS